MSVGDSRQPHDQYKRHPVVLLCVCVQVAQQIAARAAARQAKDFAAADAVRKRLAAQGIMLMDTPQGTTWRPGLPEEEGQ